MNRSIRIRVLVSIFVVVVPVLIGSAWLLARTFSERLLRDIDVALEEEAETVEGLLKAGIPDESFRRFVGVVAAESDLGARKHVVVTRGGRSIAEAPPGAANVLAGAERGTFRMARYRSSVEGQPVEVAIAVSESRPPLAHRRLAWMLWVGTPLVLLTLGFSVWASVGRALRPLERAAEGLGGIEAGTLSSRLPIETPDDEVGKIVGAVNQMLGRVERAVERLQRFPADAAHELRTPLTVLRTGLELALGKERAASENRAALRDALQQTDGVCRLAENLLTLARLDGQERPQLMAAVDVAEMLQELADGWADEAQARAMHIRVEVGGPLTVDGNGGDLYRLFNNLIDNAVRYGVSGGELRIRAQTRDDHIEVELTDDGPGIAAGDLERIFDRFYRARRDVAGPPGSGLGLSIAREIARNHGGHLTARNRDGQPGSVFVVSLPCVFRSVPPAASA